jgi:alkylhydroperoxidase family enzyme
MARIEGVPKASAPLMVRIGYFFTRRHIARLTGRQPEQMMEPLEMYAHIPTLFRAYGNLEQASAKLHHLHKRHKALAELKTSTLVHCEYCIDIGSQISRRWGLTDLELLALNDYRTSELFTDLDKLVLDYAVGLSRTPADVSEELFSELRGHFDEAQLVELTYIVALGNLRARFNIGLGIGSAGFSEGMVCALPSRR